jgi:tyrosyl-tRNA synthetase
MKLSEELAWRGFINQTTYKDLSILDDKKITFYHGFDASADSQTIGNLAGMMLDRLMMRHGHKAVILAGGATSLIGDPGGKDEERPLQNEETVAHNVKKAEEELGRIFAGQQFELVNNLDWTKNLSAIEFLRDIGKHYSMTTLLQRDFIARRLGEDSSGISYAEFSYTVLQGMDYLYLFENMEVSLQIGGSDQWGNILSGVDLVRRVHGKEVHALTLPLVINSATGKKFGKTEEGAVWLDGSKTTPFKQNPSGRAAQKTLAYEVTKLVHGAEQAKKQQRITEVLFNGQGIENLDESELVTVREEFPNLTIPSGMPVIDVLVSTGLAQSNSEARRLIQSGAVYVNNEKFSSDHLESSHFQNKRLLIRRGKAFKDSALIELE